MNLKFRFSESEGILRSVADVPGIVAPSASNIDGFSIAISPNIELASDDETVNVLTDDAAEQMTHIGAREAVEACVDDMALRYLKFAVPRVAMIAGQVFLDEPNSDELMESLVGFLEEFEEAASW